MECSPARGKKRGSKTGLPTGTDVGPEGKFLCFDFLASAFVFAGFHLFVLFSLTTRRESVYFCGNCRPEDQSHLLLVGIQAEKHFHRNRKVRLVRSEKAYKIQESERDRKFFGSTVPFYTLFPYLCPPKFSI
jgi:hypothetical protein